MNTLRFFKELEEKTKVKGMGDKDEASTILTELDVKFYDYETNELVYKGTAGRGSITSEEDLQKHVFCLSYLDFGSLEIMKKVLILLKQYLTFQISRKRIC